MQANGEQQHDRRLEREPGKRGRVRRSLSRHEGMDMNTFRLFSVRTPQSTVAAMMRAGEPGSLSWIDVGGNAAAQAAKAASLPCNEQ